MRFLSGRQRFWKEYKRNETFWFNNEFYVRWPTRHATSHYQQARVE